MDKTDVVLSQLLLMNSRLPYRELADKLDLSVSAVHKRIQALTELGIIRTFTAKISIIALRVFVVLVFGRSLALPVDEAIKKLENRDSTYWVAVAGGNYLYIGAYLRNISELEPYIAFVKKEAGMPDPTVGIVHEVPPMPDEEPPRSLPDISLHHLDYQIIYSLHKNSRKRVSEMAEELGVSPKKARF